MFYYFFFFLSTTLIGIHIDKLNNKHIGNHSKEVRFYYYLLCFLFVLFVGCRDVSVGADSWVYEYKYEWAKDSSWIQYIIQTGISDPGYYTIAWLMQQLTSNINVYFIFLSLIYFGLFLRFIKNNSNSVGWSIFILNTIGLTTFAMSTLRQSLAIVFCLLAYDLWRDKKKVAWVLYILAATVHDSAVVFIVMMCISFFVGKKTPFWLLVIVGTTITLAPSIMNFLFVNVEDGHYEVTEVGGIGMIVLLSIMIAYGYFVLFPFNDKLNKNRYHEFFAIVFALCSFVVTRFNPAAMRLYYYFLAFSVVYLPNVLSNDKKHRTPVGIVFGMVLLYYLIFRVMADPYAESRLLLPYKFFWN